MSYQFTDEDVEYWMKYCYQIATKSLDPSTQNGAVAFDAYGGYCGEGINTFTPGIPVTEEKLERPLKYSYIGHAERSAVYQSARSGIHPTAGGTMIAAWASCTDCAHAIIGAGFDRLIRHKNFSDQAMLNARNKDTWKESIDFADNLIIAAGIEIVEFERVLNADAVLLNGELWTP